MTLTLMSFLTAADFDLENSRLRLGLQNRLSKITLKHKFLTFYEESCFFVRCGLPAEMLTSAFDGERGL